MKTIEEMREAFQADECDFPHSDALDLLDDVMDLLDELLEVDSGNQGLLDAKLRDRLLALRATRHALREMGIE